MVVSDFNSICSDDEIRNKAERHLEHVLSSNVVCGVACSCQFLADPRCFKGSVLYLPGGCSLKGAGGRPRSKTSSRSST